MSTPAPRKGWIIPYLPPVFHLKDYKARSVQETPHCRGYLMALTKGKKPKLRSLGDDMFAKVGTHFCQVTFDEKGKYTWGREE